MGIYRMSVTRLVLILVSLFGLIALVGCATWESTKGVEALWRQPEHQQWNAGKTTTADVINALGPPSQIIALDDQNVFYYMQEKNTGKAYIFILWNKSEQAVYYDRAVFFFDKRGVLLKYAYSKQASGNESK